MREAAGQYSDCFEFFCPEQVAVSLFTRGYIPDRLNYRHCPAGRVFKRGDSGFKIFNTVFCVNTLFSYVGVAVEKSHACRPPIAYGIISGGCLITVFADMVAHKILMALVLIKYRGICVKNTDAVSHSIQYILTLGLFIFYSGNRILKCLLRTLKQLYGTLYKNIQHPGGDPNKDPAFKGAYFDNCRNIAEDPAY